MKVKFKKNNLIANAINLTKYFKLEKEQMVQMISFEIEIDGNSTGMVLICKGKYKSALFLLYLTKLKFKMLPGFSARFLINPEFQRLTVLYFGDKLCDDAKNNPETKHTTIRDLLTSGKVIVHINCKRGKK